MNSEVNSYSDPYSTNVDRFDDNNAWSGSSAEMVARQNAMEAAANHPADQGDTAARHGQYEQVRNARAAANEAYPKLLDYLATCSKNLASMRALALDEGELSRDKFDLAA